MAWNGGRGGVAGRERHSHRFCYGFTSDLIKKHIGGGGGSCGVSFGVTADWLELKRERRAPRSTRGHVPRGVGCSTFTCV